MDQHPETTAPVLDDILAARRRIEGKVARTPVVNEPSFDRFLGCTAFFKCENLQHTGAFKLRGATNAVQHLLEQGIAGDVATHSSGNHGAALAKAARDAGRKAHVVMPQNAVGRKVDSVKSHGGHVIFCESNQSAREAGLAELVSNGLTPIPPYDHADIIAGQGTAALELLDEKPHLDILITPVGGGGLISGSALVAASHSRKPLVFAAEPAGAADTFESFSRGSRITSIKPETIADGLRALVGQMTFPIIAEHVDAVLTVSEDAIARGVLMAHQFLGMVIEPSAATVIAAIMEHPDKFKDKSVGLILSGANIDPDMFPELAADHD